MYRILGIIFIIFSQGAYSCSCGSIEPFPVVAKNSDLVIWAKVASHNSSQSRPEMSLEIIEVLKGEYTGKILTINGGSSAACHRYNNAKQFPVGREYMLALPSPKTVSILNLSLCAESIVEIIGDTSHGRNPCALDNVDDYTIPISGIRQILLGNMPSPFQGNCRKRSLKLKQKRLIERKILESELNKKLNTE